MGVLILVQELVYVKLRFLQEVCQTLFHNPSGSPVETLVQLVDRSKTFESEIQSPFVADLQSRNLVRE